MSDAARRDASAVAAVSNLLLQATRRVALILLASGTLLVAGELFARLALGLGDPPLYQPHPTIGYLLAPGQSCRPFGNRFEVNDFSMRSAPFAAPRSASNELRVMVLGDSVINGGSLTDQSDLATGHARRELSARLGRPVIVGNISSGSWGPGNRLGYVEEFGLFEPDRVLLMLSSHDAFGVPTLGPLNPVEHPTRKPRFALSDGLRYFRRLFPGQRGPVRGSRQTAIPALEALLVRLAEVPGASVLLHPLRAELESGEWEAGAAPIRAAVEKRNLRMVELARYYDGSDPANLYRDVVHPSAEGQQRLARAIVDVVIDLESGATTSR